MIAEGMIREAGTMLTPRREAFWQDMEKVLKRSPYGRPDSTGFPVIGGGYGISWIEDRHVTTEAVIYNQRGQVWAEIEDRKYTDPRKAAKAVIGVLDQKWDEARYETEFKAASGKTASTGSDLLDYVIPSRDMWKLGRSFEDADDQASADLFYKVVDGLQDAMDVSSNEFRALNRLRQGVSAQGKWDLDLQRNNLFKAANLLGIKLPHGMF